VKSGNVAGSGFTIPSSTRPGQKEVNLLQIWVFPDTQNVEPRYDQALFQEETMNGKWKTLFLPDGNDGSLWIHQQAWFSLGRICRE
jgi:redox-sensitive bicupin YhaK (pirin superfamily)